MAEKVKVSREVGSSIQYALECGTKERLLIYHTNNFDGDGSLKDGATWTAREYLGLNQLTPEDLAIALYVGYEIEETPENKLYDIWKRTWDEYNRITDHQRISGGHYENGYAKGIEAALETLGVKIEGINK